MLFMQSHSFFIHTLIVDENTLIKLCVRHMAQSEGHINGRRGATLSCRERNL